MKIIKKDQKIYNVTIHNGTNVKYLAGGHNAPKKDIYIPEQDLVNHDPNCMLHIIFYMHEFSREVCWFIVKQSPKINAAHNSPTVITDHIKTVSSPAIYDSTTNPEYKNVLYLCGTDHHQNAALHANDIDGIRNNIPVWSEELTKANIPHKFEIIEV